MNAAAPLRPRYPLSFRLYPYTRSSDQAPGAGGHHPVVVVGAGPVGLTLALALGLKGHRTIVLDDHEGVGLGSRAICFSKRTLEIAHRLGAGPSLLAKGVVWQTGRVFHGADEIYHFDLLPEPGFRYPAFINLQQPHFERLIFEALERAKAAGAPIEVRGANRVDSIKPSADGVSLAVMTPDGPYRLGASWVVACDGAKSTIRDMLDLGFEGRAFVDNFLIADVRMRADFPPERWFWFEPWFRSGASALLHKQPDDLWRIDFQIGSDIDRNTELQEGNVRARVDAMLGGKVEYEIDWCSIYRFFSRRMKRFRHGRIFFAGDSAHQVSPFGARGANSGIEDADNLAWKLAMVLDGLAGAALLDSYDEERVPAADANLQATARSTDFMTPRNEISRDFRDAALALARNHEFARAMVNSGRLSTAATYRASSLNSPDGLDAPATARPGMPCPDAPLRDGFLLDRLGGDFVLLGLGVPVPERQVINGIVTRGVSVNTDEVSADMHNRYLGDITSAVYLVRPDQYVAARWGGFEPAAVERALARATGNMAMHAEAGNTSGGMAWPLS